MIYTHVLNRGGRGVQSQPLRVYGLIGGPVGAERCWIWCALIPEAPETLIHPD